MRGELSSVRSHLSEQKLEIENDLKTFYNCIKSDYDKLGANCNALIDAKEQTANLLRNKCEFENSALKQCIESLTKEMEEINNQKRCILSERDSLRKHYQDFVEMTRPDIMKNQSGILTITKAFLKNVSG